MKSKKPKLSARASFFAFKEKPPSSEQEVILRFFGVDSSDEERAKHCIQKYKDLFSKFKIDLSDPFCKTKLILELAGKSAIKNFSNADIPLRGKGNPQKWDKMDFLWVYIVIEARIRHGKFTEDEAIQDFLAEQKRYREMFGKDHMPPIKSYKGKNGLEPDDAMFYRIEEIYKAGRRLATKKNYAGIFGKDFTPESMVERFGSKYSQK